MARRPDRSTVDLSDYPNLVVIYLGMRAHHWSGVKTMIKFLPQVRKAVMEQPDGLLLNDYWFYSPRHVGVRQYWRDFESLESWARTEPHSVWWRDFLRDPGGAGFYHEAYSRQGSMEGMYVEMKPGPFGFMRFAPVVPARGSMFSARQRAQIEGTARDAAPLSEPELYGSTVLDVSEPV
jgi:hypothetical protein